MYPWLSTTLAVLRDPHVDAGGAAFGVDQLLQIRKGKAAIAS
jgi:hypothetical protein